MGQIQVVYTSGYCPETEDEQEIRVNFLEIQAVGQSGPAYKKDTFYCDYESQYGCVHSRKCPVYEDCMTP